MLTARVTLPLVARHSLSKALVASGSVGRFYQMGAKNPTRWRPVQYSIPTKEDWEDEESRKELIGKWAKERARRLAESAEEESRHPSYENHTIPMGEVDKEGELHAKQRAEWLAEEAEEESSHPDYENHSIPIEEVDKELDEQDLQMRDTPNEEISLFTPHITFPVNYPTVEQIERITKAKAEMEQIKAKEDDVRHHAWE